MSLLKTIVLSAMVARGVQASTLSLDGGSVSCPDGWSFSQMGTGKTYCCWGSSIIEGDEGWCCINQESYSEGGGEVTGESTLVTGNTDFTYSSCYPFCDETTTAGADKRSISIPEPQCATKIPYTAKDYTKLVSEASSSVKAKASSGSGSSSGDKPASTTAEPTASSSGDDSDSASAKKTDATDSDDAAMPMITGNAMYKYGGAAVAAAMLAL